MSVDIAWLEERLNRKLSKDEAAALSAEVQIVKVAAGAKIIEEGKHGGVLSIVRSGSAVVQHGGAAPVVLATLGEGAAVGEMSFLTDEAASASVVAQTECVIYRITRAGFSKVMSQYHDLAYSVFAYMLRHTATVIRQMNENHVSMTQYVMGSRMGF